MSLLRNDSSRRGLTKWTIYSPDGTRAVGGSWNRNVLRTDVDISGLVEILKYYKDAFSNKKQQHAAF